VIQRTSNSDFEVQKVKASQFRAIEAQVLLFRMQGISLVIQLILGGHNLISRSLLLHSLQLNHFPRGIFSWFSLQIHNLMTRLLEIPFGNMLCRRITTPFLLGGNLSDGNGSTGPRAQRMNILEDTNLGLSPKAFSRFMVLNMMRPFL
jgi:hypothetical protein